MVGLEQKRQPLRKKSQHHLSQDVMHAVTDLENLFTVDQARLKKITEKFLFELEKGLAKDGENIAMNPTWVMGFPTGEEQGTFLALDMGGTNLRVCEIILLEGKGKFDIIQSKYRIPKELKTGTAEELWDYVADCIEQFLEDHHEDKDLAHMPLGFTFSYPTAQNYIDHGVLQRWTKGYDIRGVEREDVVPQLEVALKKRKIPITLAALTNDTTGTLIASAYTDQLMKIGCIFGTGCNGAYMENCGSIPKLAHLNLPSDLPMAINCEYGAFDNEHVVLPLTPYDVAIDMDSPRPGQQTFEKMIAGLYLGEIFRLILIDYHENKNLIFQGQNIAALKKPYSIDASFLSNLEEDSSESLQDSQYIILEKLDLRAEIHELEFCRRLAELIGTRAARLSACAIAAICKKKNLDSCHVGADGAVFNKYPHFKDRCAQALKEIIEWPDDLERDPVEVSAAEDGSGVGAALIAALTIKRIEEGNLVGIKDHTQFKGA